MLSKVSDTFPRIFNFDALYHNTQIQNVVDVKCFKSSILKNCTHFFTIFV